MLNLRIVLVAEIPTKSFQQKFAKFQSCCHIHILVYNVLCQFKVEIRAFVFFQVVISQRSLLTMLVTYFSTYPKSLTNGKSGTIRFESALFCNNVLHILQNSKEGEGGR